MLKYKLKKQFCFQSKVFAHFAAKIHFKDAEKGVRGEGERIKAIYTIILLIIISMCLAKRPSYSCVSTSTILDVLINCHADIPPLV